MGRGFPPVSSFRVENGALFRAPHFVVVVALGIGFNADTTRKLCNGYQSSCESLHALIVQRQYEGSPKKQIYKSLISHH